MNEEEAKTIPHSVKTWSETRATQAGTSKKKGLRGNCKSRLEGLTAMCARAHTVLNQTSSTGGKRKRNNVQKQKEGGVWTCNPFMVLALALHNKWFLIASSLIFTNSSILLPSNTSLI
jgi:hypothetical protein